MNKIIPVSIVTGFLGSGKTTLVGRILRSPGLDRTAVIVNEFGEIGLDHDLIATSDESLVTLTTGCICCAVRGDLVETLLDLRHKRDEGRANYDRVLIETSGLADPAPILHALMTDPAVTATHAIDSVVTVVDAVHGVGTMERHPEARRQVAVADCLVLSKMDLYTETDQPQCAATWRSRLEELNPGAAIIMAAAVTPDVLYTPADGPTRALRLSRIPDQPAKSPFSQARHSEDIETFSIRRDRPVPALALTLLLQALAEHCGSRLLRVKGLVDIAEMPGKPAVIHGVQHVFSPPEFLDAWPSDDRNTRIVFIAKGVPRHFPARLLDAIEAEVRDTVA
jgi:G3E family GTPase